MPIATIKLMGGLGNQLFQVFTLLAYADQYRMNISLPNTLYSGERNIQYFNNIFSRLKDYVRAPISTPTEYYEPSFQYTPIPAGLSRQSLVLDGYFQSPLYFNTFKLAIFSQLHLGPKMNKVRQQHPEINFPQTIAMHFRLGDYLDKTEFHPILPLIYYTRSVQFILSHQSHPTPSQVLVFFEKADEDRINDNTHQLSVQFPQLQFRRVDTNIPDWQQLLMISLCQHHIIANSTFSWWGAYLGHISHVGSSGTGRVTCYPSTWFGTALPNHSTADLFPPGNGWSRVSCQ